MSYCKCNPIKTKGGNMCLICWPYCAICNGKPHPKYPGDTRFICEECECESVSIKGNAEVSRLTGLLKAQIENSSVKSGYSKNGPRKFYSTHEKYYCIQDLISVGEKLFKADPKKLKKLEKFKAKWKSDIELKNQEKDKKKQIIESVKLLGKFDMVIDYDDQEIKDIIHDRFLHDLDNPQVTHLLICDLENHVYDTFRKNSLDKLIDDKIPKEYHEYIKESIEYDDYIYSHHKNDDLLPEIFATLYKLYDAKSNSDTRNKTIIDHMNSKTNDINLTKKLLHSPNCKQIFDDVTIPANEACKKLDEITSSVIEKYKNILEMQNALKEFDIGITVNLNLYTGTMAPKKAVAKKTVVPNYF